MSGMMIFDR